MARVGSQLAGQISQVSLLCSNVSTCSLSNLLVAFSHSGSTLQISVLATRHDDNDLYRLPGPLTDDSYLQWRPLIGLAEPNGPDQGLYSASVPTTGSLLRHSPATVNSQLLHCTLCSGSIEFYSVIQWTSPFSGLRGPLSPLSLWRN